MKTEMIEWNGDRLQAGKNEDGKIFVPLRPICVALGLHWASELEKAYADDVLKPVVRKMRTTLNGQAHDSICIPLEMLNGWLMTVNPSKRSKANREKINQYKVECYRVLFEHFHPKSLFPEDSTPMQLASWNAAAERVMEKARKHNAGIRYYLRAMMIRWKMRGEDFLRLAKEAAEIPGTVGDYDWHRWDVGTPTASDIERSEDPYFHI